MYVEHRTLSIFVQLMYLPPINIFPNNGKASIYLHLSVAVHTEKYFRKLIKSLFQNLSVFTIIRLIQYLTDVCLAPNQSENGEYNLISVCSIRFRKDFSVRACKLCAVRSEKKIAQLKFVPLIKFIMTKTIFKIHPWVHCRKLG